MAKEEFDIDAEIEKLSRKSNIDIKKSEYAFENRLKKLDKDIKEVMDRRIKEFDNSKKLTSEYLNIDYTQDSIDRYREKLKKI
ncbi:hypothetical protein [Methanobrevibacter sp.]|uniref:hypothetical protein n=1 Tax=Methanobrevibacter sp. TaxID=66852 RepID=UPI00386EC44E